MSPENVNLSLPPNSLSIFTPTSHLPPITFLTEWQPNPFGCPSLWFLSHLSYPINYQVLLVVTHYVCVSLLHSPWTHCHTPVQATLISSCAYLDSWLVPLLPVLPRSVLFSTVKSEIRHQTLDQFMPSPCVKPSLISIYLRQHKEQNFNIIYNSFPS